jgi:3' exoribonuclease, RNase T-like
MPHLMLDLETWGTRPGCAIRSIGAAMFDPAGEGPIGETFYRNISDRSNWIAGLFVDKDTAAWWAEQSEEAKSIFAVDPRHLPSVAYDFHAWILCNNKFTIHPWCQGSGFDTAIWEAAATAVGQLVPWKFWNIRDTRTAYHLANLDDKTIPRVGTAHNALDDVLHQIKCVQAAYKLLRNVP